MAGRFLLIVVVVLIVLRVGWRFFKKTHKTEDGEHPAVVKKPLVPWQRRFFTVLIFAKVNTRRYFRDRTAIFFTVAFPLIFLFVFGGIFGKNAGVTFKIAILNQSHSQYAQQFVNTAEKDKTFKVNKTVASLSDANNQMAHGALDATIILPANFGTVKPRQALPSGRAEVYYTENNVEAAQTLVSVLQAEFQGINTSLVKAPTPFTVMSKESNSQGLSQFDYTFSGLVGFAIIGMGIFGPINVFPELKKQGILRRFHTTPIRVWQYFMANMFSQAIIGMMTMVIMFGFAIGLFHLKVVGNYLELIPFLILGIVTILGIGLALGGWAKNERQVAPLANIIVFPMMFLSGTFFPRYLMPEWLQRVSAFLPLTPIIDGVRLITAEGKSLVEIGPQIGLTAVWAIVIYAIAFRVFRWE